MLTRLNTPPQPVLTQCVNTSMRQVLTCLNTWPSQVLTQVCEQRLNVNTWTLLNPALGRIRHVNPSLPLVREKDAPCYYARRGAAVAVPVLRKRSRSLDIISFMSTLS